MTTHTRQRKSPGEWRPLILAAALAAARDGLASVTLRGVARTCGISHKQVALSYGTVDALRDAVAAEAVRVGDLTVIGRLVVDRHRAVAGMDGDARARAVASLA